MSDLHTEGWRQGSIVVFELTASHLTYLDERIQEISTSFNRWVVCTQDCDLRSSRIDADEPLIELRPILCDNPPSDWGIRSRRFLLDKEAYVDGRSPPVVANDRPEERIITVIIELGGWCHCSQTLRQFLLSPTRQRVPNMRLNCVQGEPPPAPGRLKRFSVTIDTNSRGS